MKTMRYEIKLILRTVTILATIFAMTFVLAGSASAVVIGPTVFHPPVQSIGVPPIARPPLGVQSFVRPPVFNPFIGVDPDDLGFGLGLGIGAVGIGAAD